jgi:peptide/nickel transport system substrate-binding protein
MIRITKRSVFIPMACAVLMVIINWGVCQGDDTQTLVMGAQKDFMAVYEGKHLIFESLASSDAFGHLQPKLAESWTTSPDAKNWTFALRQDVRYHDGTVFNAKSAKFDLQRAMRDAYWAKYIDALTVLDEFSLEVTFNTSFPTFLLDLAGVAQPESFISPTAVDPSWGPTGRIVQYAGTGPFKLADYRKDRDATLVRNPDYWDKPALLDRIVWKYTPEPYAQIMALKSGELDIIGVPEHHSSVPFMKLDELSSNPALTVAKQSYGRYQVLEFNCRKAPFNDQRVRAALNCAIDRETMVRSLFGNITDPCGLITDPKFVWGPSNIKGGYRYDPEQAEQLLRESGWIDNDGDGILDKGGRSFDINLLVTTGEANGDMIALVVQSQLKKMGIHMRIETSMDGTDKQASGAYDLFLHHSGCLPSIPGGIGIGEKYHSAGGWPYAFHSKALDELIEAAFTTTDPVKQRKKCDEIWRLLHAANPCIPLYDVTKAVVMNKKVKGFRHGATMFDMDLTGVFIRL